MLFSSIWTTSEAWQAILQAVPQSSEEFEEVLHKRLKSKLESEKKYFLWYKSRRDVSAGAKQLLSVQETQSRNKLSVSVRKYQGQCSFLKLIATL